MKNLKARRKEMGFTCETLGNEVNVQKAAISKYERGEIQPSQDILLNLARVLSCTTDYLLGLTDNPKPIELVIPDDITHDDKFSFHRWEFEGLSQDEVDKLAEFARFIKAQRQEEHRNNIEG